MSSRESVTEWLDKLTHRDSRAAENLWNRYIQRLVRLARTRLRASPRRAADEEDVAVNAFASFCNGVEEGRFAKLDDRDDLWKVLVVLTERKAVDLIRREGAQKRGGGDVRGESALDAQRDIESPGAGVSQIPDDVPTPAFAAAFAEQLERSLAMLEDDALRRIARDRLYGYTNKEIAKRLDVSLRTVERGLQLIRRIWSEG